MKDLCAKPFERLLRMSFSFHVMVAFFKSRTSKGRAGGFTIALRDFFFS